MPVAPLLSGAVLVLLLLLAAGGAEGHGVVVDPPSRVKLCAARNGSFTALDEQTATRWAKNPVKTGRQTFKWYFPAARKTFDFRYFITKADWNPNAPLTRDQFELTPFCRIVTGTQEPCPIPPREVTHECDLPARDGYHVVLVWYVAQDGGRSNEVIDIDFSGAAAPAPEETKTTLRQEHAKAVDRHVARLTSLIREGGNTRGKQIFEFWSLEEELQTAMHDVRKAWHDSEMGQIRKQLERAIKERNVYNQNMELAVSRLDEEVLKGDMQASRLERAKANPTPRSPAGRPSRVPVPDPPAEAPPGVEHYHQVVVDVWALIVKAVFLAGGLLTALRVVIGMAVTLQLARQGLGSEGGKAEQPQKQALTIDSWTEPLPVTDPFLLEVARLGQENDASPAMPPSSEASVPGAWFSLSLKRLVEEVIRHERGLDLEQSVKYQQLYDTLDKPQQGLAHRDGKIAELEKQIFEFRSREEERQREQTAMLDESESWHGCDMDQIGEWLELAIEQRNEYKDKMEHAESKLGIQELVLESLRRRLRRYKSSLLRRNSV